MCIASDRAPSRKMEVLLRMVAEEGELQKAEGGRSDRDALSAFVRSMGGAQAVVQIARERRDVDWDAVVRTCKDKAESVVEGVRARAGKDGLEMDANTRQQVLRMAFREACGRQLSTILKQASEKLSAATGDDDPFLVSRTLASPLVEGARFNQVPPDAIRGLKAAEGYGLIPRFMAREWEALCVLDAERALRTGKLSQFLVIQPSNHGELFPAVTSVAEVLTAIPHELNLKTGSRFCEVSTSSEMWLWKDSFQLPPPTGQGRTQSRMVALYAFSRSESSAIKLRCDKREIDVLHNSVVLIALTNPPFTAKLALSPLNSWMVGVAFDGV